MRISYAEKISNCLGTGWDVVDDDHESCPRHLVHIYRYLPKHWWIFSWISRSHVATMVIGDEEICYCNSRESYEPVSEACKTIGYETVLGSIPGRFMYCPEAI